MYKGIPLSVGRRSNFFFEGERSKRMQKFEGWSYLGLQGWHCLFIKQYIAKDQANHIRRDSCIRLLINVFLVVQNRLTKKKLSLMLSKSKQFSFKKNTLHNIVTEKDGDKILNMDFIITKFGFELNPELLQIFNSLLENVFLY